jgi:hypothetical protein
MMKRYLFYSFFIFSVACTVSDKTASTVKNQFHVNIGFNHSGIIENTDMKKVPDAPVDAFTGATSMGYNAGVHIEHRLKRHSLESGLDLIINNQKFTYNDQVNQFFGERKIITTQVRIPVLYDFSIFRNSNQENIAQIKLGITPGLNFNSVTNSGTNLPAYSFSHFSFGIMAAFTITPFHFKNGKYLGLTVEMFRLGTKVYNDFYQKGDMPGLSNLGYMITYGF